MLPKSLDHIQLADLQGLIGTVRESKTLEFKQAMPAKNDKEVIQFLASVSAFANTAGGDLLIGVAAEDGVAVALPGIPLAELDHDTLRYEQLLAGNIEPRLPTIGTRSVPCGGSNHILIIRTTRSWLGPHRVTKNDKFYGRNAGGRYPLDVGELRQAFTLRENIAERIRAFRRDRLNKIVANITPGHLAPSASLVLHVIPIPSFGDRRLINVAQELNSRPVTLPVPLGATGVGSGVNLDGVFVYSGPSLAQCHGYGLLFRDCCIEGVKQLSVRNDEPYLAGAVFEQDVVSTLRSYLQTCAQLDAGYPVYVGLSLCNAKGCALASDGAGYWADNGARLNEEVIALPECVVESPEADVPALMKTAFDMIWNAFGYFQSEKYNSEGKWIGTA
jgi:hypothetical protein